MDYMLITNDPEQVRMATHTGVRRVMVDLELIGKYDRQGHKDTHITSHSPEDIAKVKAILPEGAELVVRVNPYHEAVEHLGTKTEIDHAIEKGADIIMLPMFRSVREVQKTANIIQGRAKFIPLLEHIDALECMKEICETCPLDEAYLGLNDLHLSLNQSFLFETLLTDHVQHFCEIAQRYGLPYGFGGIGSVLHESADVPIPPSLIMKEHARLGSTRVILSRAFKAVAHSEDFAAEVSALNNAYESAQMRDDERLHFDYEKLCAAVEGVVATLNHSQPR